MGAVVSPVTQVLWLSPGVSSQATCCSRFMQEFGLRPGVPGFQGRALGCWYRHSCSDLWCEGVVPGSEMCSIVKLQSLLLRECKSKLSVGGDWALRSHLWERYSKLKLNPEISFSVFFLSLLFKN